MRRWNETVMFIMQFLPLDKIAIKKQVKEAVHKLLNNEKFRENIGNHRDSAKKLNWRLEQAELIGRSFQK